tara:strand:+ start:279 stop:503 length:225 start_codon:yes stop_codon:yes gene_type:complete
MSTVKVIATNKQAGKILVAASEVMADMKLGGYGVHELNSDELSVIRINNLLLSGNELQLTAEDSKAFDLVCGGE